MKAVRIHEFGGPDKMHLENVAMPDPRPGEFLVRVVAAALNPIDWKIREHLVPAKGADDMPLILGRDFSGIIVALGPGTAEPFPDTLPPIRIGSEVLGEISGSFAEYVTVPAKDAVLKPPSLDLVTAASLPMPSLTAWQAVIDIAQARANMHFLVHGAAGSVGSFAAQLARMQGASVTATASRPSFEWLRQIGVDEIVDYQHQRFEDEVHDVDVVIDPMGGDVQARSFKVLKRGGLLINLVGQIDERAAEQAGVRAVTLFMRYDADELREIVGLVERGLLRPHVTSVLSLSEARKAMDLNQQGRSHGQIVLKVA
jgi:NADPH:quinone reductase-like Zn-dependent oxidoreductase